MIALGHIFGTMLAVGVIGPLFWLGVNVLEGWLQRKGFPLAGFDLFSWACWRKVLLHRVGGGASTKAAAHKRLS